MVSDFIYEMYGMLIKKRVNIAADVGISKQVLTSQMISLPGKGSTFYFTIASE